MYNMLILNAVLGPIYNLGKEISMEFQLYLPAV